MAARYLSLDQITFNGVTRQFRIAPVEPAPGSIRWRKSDLDRLAKKIEPVPQPTRSPDAASAMINLDPHSLRQLADLIVRQLGADCGGLNGEFLTIKETCQLLKSSRAKVYQLIGERALEVKHVGRRTLITRASIDAFLR